MAKQADTKNPFEKIPQNSNYTGPKRKDDDCDMVTSLQASELSKNELCLHEAARQNDEMLLRKIIRKNAANINCKNNLDRTALHMAASQGHLEAVKIIIMEGKALVDIPDKYGMTPLLWAAYFGHLEVIMFLVEKGAIITKRNKQGCDIVHIASEGNFVTILEYLFRKHRHCKIDEPDNNGMTPFLLAVSKNADLATKALTEKDCDFFQCDKTNKNAWHLACKNGHEKVFRVLIDLEVPFDLMDKLDSSDKSPMHYACENGFVRIVELLIEKEADITLPTGNGFTPLHIATQKNFEEIVLALIKADADINCQNQQGNTPLHIATLSNLPHMVSLLLDNNADMDMVNNRDQTPLHSGVEQNKCDSVEILLLRGANLTNMDKTGKTPLLMAARGSYVSMVDMIIKAERHNKRIEDIKAEDAHRVANLNQSNGEFGADADAFRPSDYANVYNIHLEEAKKSIVEDTTFTLKEFNQPYAEEFKLYLWKIAFNNLRFGEWKKLAHFWEFKPEHILAIEYQQVKDSSYKYHGYRVLCIWFHGVESQDTPIRGLYEALVSIGRRKLADKIRRELDSENGKAKSSASCTIH